jgi:alpha-L-fucosidase 2
MDRPENFKTFSESNQLIMAGALPNGKGQDGLEYMTRLKGVNKNGALEYVGDSLVVENADEVTLYLSASTDYVLDPPNYKGRDYINITEANIKKAQTKSFDDLFAAHKEEYQNYYQRVNLDITPEEIVPLATDTRLKKYKETKNDPHLEELMFQYGRYLLISSSRPGNLPSNLQGIWANKIQTPWNGDYHTDINVQMNYWQAETTNLSELHLPLFNLLTSLVPSGERTAEVQYHSKGWVLHPITNVWGYTSPGESASWGMHTGGGAWLSTHIAEHYAFTQDKDFLKQMYPVLKGSVDFYMDWLVKDPKTGKLVSGPAVSPENTFIAPDGSRSQISMGPAHDQQVIWQLFTDFLFASQVLGIENPYIQQVAEAKNNLAGPQIGTDGRLMEWADEFEEVEPGHRHISHLFALHPGNQISRIETPTLAEAAKKSLDYRIANGGGGTGWSAAWLVNQYARLGDGDMAKSSLETVLTKSTANNMFGLHPPFQMDANFGTTAGIAEMLLQSHAGAIEFLPALPKAWPTGNVNGLKARGNITVDMKWENGELLYADILAPEATDVMVTYGALKKDISLKANERYRWEVVKQN